MDGEEFWKLPADGSVNGIEESGSASDSGGLCVSYHITPDTELQSVGVHKQNQQKFYLNKETKTKKET